MTILELVVALAIVAGLLAMTSAAIRPPHEMKQSDQARAADFVVAAKMDAVLSGRAIVMWIDEQGLRYGSKRLDWLQEVGPDLSTVADTLVVFPDGSLSSDALSTWPTLQDSGYR